MMLVFLLEERSAKCFLDNFLPRILPNEAVNFRCIAFEGKQDLERQLKRKITHWLTPNTHFIVMRDQDTGNCKIIKQKLLQLCKEAGRADSLVRIACHELESWYLGDLSSVESALQIKGLVKLQNNQKFKTPDQLANASEELQKITKHKYTKIAGSRAIGLVMQPDDNKSVSFNQFVSGLQRLVSRPVL